MLTRLFRRDTAGHKGQSDQLADADGDATVMLSASAVVEDDENGWKPGDVLLDRYKVEEVFAGAMGKVYISTHLGWDVKMAIKSPRKEVLADEEGIHRIIREADGLVSLVCTQILHPAITYCPSIKSPIFLLNMLTAGPLKSGLWKGDVKICVRP